MKRVIEKDQVAHFWANQTQSDARTPSSKFSFTGPELRSYGTSIAYHFGAFILFSRNTFSVTTSAQISRARQAARHIKQIESGVFSYGTRYSYNAPTCADIFADLDKQIENLYRDINAPRIRMTTRAGIAQKIRHTADDLNYLIDYFQADRTPVTIPADLDTLINESKSTLDRLQKERDDAARAAELKAQKENAALLKQWINGASVYLPYAIRRNNGSHLLTVRGADVTTSENSSAPLSHVVRALDFYASRRTGKNTFTAWKKNGHRVPLGVFELDAIDAAGNVSAGCHYFSAAEIARFSKKWRAALDAARPVKGADNGAEN